MGSKPEILEKFGSIKKILHAKKENFDFTQKIDHIENNYLSSSKKIFVKKQI